MADLEGKLGEVEVKFAQAESVILVWDKEIVDLKIAVTQSEQKFYNMGFIDVENSNEAVMFESQCYRFREGWIAILNALHLPKNSPFRDPEQIPLPKPLPCPPV